VGLLQLMGVNRSQLGSRAINRGPLEVNGGQWRSTGVKRGPLGQMGK